MNTELNTLLELQPGAELDAAVATHVLGWKWSDDWQQVVPPAQWAAPSQMWTRSGDIFIPNTLAFTPGVTYDNALRAIRVPSFSTDFAAACTLLTKYDSNVRVAFLPPVERQENRRLVTVDIGPIFEPRFYEAVWQALPTAAYAISRAALRERLEK